MKKELLEKFKSGEVAVLCKTKKESDLFLKMIKEENIKWVNNKMVDIDVWSDFKERTYYVYSISGDGLLYGEYIEGYKLYQHAELMEFEEFEKRFEFKPEEKVIETKTPKEKRIEKVLKNVDTTIKKELKDGTEVNVTISPKGVPQSNVTGVTWDKRRKQWEVRISENGKRRRIGFFDDVIKGAKARKEAEKEKERRTKNKGEKND